MLSTFWKRIMNPLLVLSLSAVLTVPPCAVLADPRQPVDEAEVLSPASPARAAARDATDLPGIEKLVRLARSTDDPRLYGRAEASLQHHLDERPDAPALLRLRARIREADHDFSGALADLGAVLSADPGDPQARLSRAFIHAAIGDYDAARRDCAASPGRAPATLACQARILSLTGKADRALALLESPALSRAQPAIRAWSASIAAEIAARTGNDGLADAKFLKALSYGDQTVRIRVAYAQHLLDTNRPAKALDALTGIETDNALLVAAMAEKALARPFDEKAAALADSFDHAHRRGAAKHLREEARFRLSVLDDPSGALDLAARNWKVQKEPEDLRVLLEAALAAGQPDHAADALDWIARHGLEDVRAADLANQIAGKI